MKLDGMVSVITGAGRGIGRSIARAFAREGSNIVLAARSPDQLEEVAGEVKALGRKVLPVSCDVSSPEEVKKLADRVRERFGRADILVNNAGTSRRSKILDYDDDTWLGVLKVNLFGTYLCCKAFLPMLQEQGRGRIINVASTAGKNPVPFNTAYSASKHGVLGLTKSLAGEVALSGYPEITVNAICPFYVNTDMLTGPQGYVAAMAGISGMSRQEVLEKSVHRNYQKRVLEPEEIASMAVYLASDEARGITGQAINICGGAVFH
ncbi:MAG: SDR family oxidoreductase [Desulfobacteraceae bacterium]|nr:MAG: SDR family oxidoreductase [Desulfobacteraceae bacterium]